MYATYNNNYVNCAEIFLQVVWIIVILPQCTYIAKFESSEWKSQIRLLILGLACMHAFVFHQMWLLPITVTTMADKWNTHTHYSAPSLWCVFFSQLFCTNVHTLYLASQSEYIDACCVSSGGTPTPAGTSVFTKHNWDRGMGYLWLNGWGIYHLMGGAFMAYWVGHLWLNGWGIYIT